MYIWNFMHRFQSLSGEVDNFSSLLNYGGGFDFFYMFITTLVVTLCHLVHCINQGITISYELHSVGIIIPVGARCSFVVCRCRILQFVRKWSIMEWCGQIQCFCKLKTISWPSVCSSCVLFVDRWCTDSCSTER
jgi:hypothetical protein